MVRDPENGRGNVISDILLSVWDRFEVHGVEIPFSQLDVHLGSLVCVSANTHLFEPIKADDLVNSIR